MSRTCKYPRCHCIGKPSRGLVGSLMESRYPCGFTKTKELPPKRLKWWREAMKRWER